jgi:Fe-S oxidoreductase
MYTAHEGSEIKVIHMVQFVDGLIKEGKLKLTHPLNLKVTYHDPCHLGRQGEPYVPWSGKEKKIFGQAVCYDPPRPKYNGAWGVYEPPRNILKAIPGVQLVEMERIKEAGWCCGAGGGAPEAYPEFSRWTATERIEEAKSTGADAIVSACPWCERNFLDATAGDGTKMKVLDIMELVEQAI